MEKRMILLRHRIQRALFSTTICFVVFFGLCTEAEQRSVADIKKDMRIVTVLDEPWMMQNTEDPEATGNDRYVGFIKDVLDEISDKAELNYTLYVAPDGKYGTHNPVTNEWSGMIGEVMNLRADMAASPMTINAHRLLHVDLTKPFISTGVGILYKQPEPETAGGDTFLKPFRVDAWLSLLGVYVFISICLWLVARCSPNERRRMDASGEPVFSVSNVFWLTSSSLLLRGSDTQPRSLATRLMVLIWWLFSLVLLVLYATLVAREYSVAKVATKISTWADLLNEDVEFGTIRFGSTQALFKDSKSGVMQALYDKMERKQGGRGYVSNNQEGVQRVLDGNGRYAFIMETAAADYEIRKHCGQLMRVGDNLQPRSYGMALPANSPMTNTISVAILRLQEQGAITALYEKWWSGPSNKCSSAGVKDEVQLYTLDAYDMRGVFVGLTICVVVALAVAIFEVVWYALWSADVTKPFASRLIDEFRQIVGLDRTVGGQPESERFTNSVT